MSISRPEENLDKLADNARPAELSRSPAIAEDERLAGPASDEARDQLPLDGVLEADIDPMPIDDSSPEIIDPQAHMEPIVSPAASLLRFITCGSVDDGKSTLIGRLLYETNAVFDDQMEALERDSKKFGTTGGDLDFALLVDGLSAEREQGITIDVAYRYFSTGGRAFIIADTPGHEQYTRNMATGASQAELAVILVDARKGILPQTRRHSFITSLVGIKSVVVAINKMDLVDFSEERFDAIKREYEALRPAFGFTEVVYVPLSAKNGDNIATRSANTPWYAGKTLLKHLETVEPETFDTSSSAFRMPVQWVNRPNLDFRGFAGTIVAGAVAPGDDVLVMPGRRSVNISQVWGPNGQVERAETGEAVTVTLDAEVDVSRGDVLVAANDDIAAHRTVDAEILWMIDRPLVAGGRVIAKLAAATSAASIQRLGEAVDIHSFQPKPVSALSMNEIGRVTLAFERPIVATTYERNRELGSFILIDAVTNETVALGVVSGFPPAQDPAEVESAIRPSTDIRTRARSLWFGDIKRAEERHALRYRAAASAVMAFVAFLFGLAPLPAFLLGVVDFLLRPFLKLAFAGDGKGGGDSAPVTAGDRSTVDRGAGI